jgi:hypothetical protein
MEEYQIEEYQIEEYQIEEYQIEEYQMEEYYNINFQVKYNEIWKELLNNLTTNNENLSDEEKYSEEDIECICRKLYLDEISHIFYGNDFLDDKLDVGFRKVFELQ